jgi:hypothetical protein
MTAESPPEAVPDPEPPAGVTARGAAFWRSVAADFDLTDSDLELLAEAVWFMSEIDALREALAHDGVTVTGSRGQRRVHPAVGEVRQHRLALARILKQLDLPAEDEESDSQTTKDARAAANVRWDMERARRRGQA